jgi:DNA-binding protein HU-beta
MNKAELVASIAEKAGLTKKDAELALNSMVETIQEELVAGGKVQLIGFGAFEVRDRKERYGRDLRDPEKKILIPAKKAPVFTAGSKLKEAVNQQG